MRELILLTIGIAIIPGLAGSYKIWQLLGGDKLADRFIERIERWNQKN